MTGAELAEFLRARGAAWRWRSTAAARRRCRRRRARHHALRRRRARRREPPRRQVRLAAQGRARTASSASTGHRLRHRLARCDLRRARSRSTMAAPMTSGTDAGLRLHEHHATARVRHRAQDRVCHQEAVPPGRPPASSSYNSVAMCEGTDALDAGVVAATDRRRRAPPPHGRRHDDGGNGVDRPRRRLLRRQWALVSTGILAAACSWSLGSCGAVAVQPRQGLSSVHTQLLTDDASGLLLERIVSAPRRRPGPIRARSTCSTRARRWSARTPTTTSCSPMPRSRATTSRSACAATASRSATSTPRTAPSTAARASARSCSTGRRGCAWASTPRWMSSPSTPASISASGRAIASATCSAPRSR